MKNSYSINTTKVDEFIEFFPNLYQEFMDYGGNVFNDTNIKDRVIKCFYACAICNNMNWDFLCKNVIPTIYLETDGFEFKKICEISTGKFEEYFMDYPKKHKIEADNRLAMLRKLSNYVGHTEGKVFDKILKVHMLEGEHGLLNIINTLPVFCDDPLHKKGNLLVQILLREGIIHVEDESNTEPAVDYHVIRFFLRTGFIQFNNEEIFDCLSSNANFELDEINDLRQTISECMKYIYRKSGIAIAKLSFIAWSIGRDYCRNEHAICDDKGNCPVCKICKGYVDLKYRKLKEPMCNVGYY